MQESGAFTGYLPETIKSYIENHFYLHINFQSTLEQLMRDPGFVYDPVHHPGLFSDHGVVHVRDVTLQLFRVLDTIHGVLIPERSSSRLDQFMKGYGEIVACLHDIGMADSSRLGRQMHPEFAAQWVFSTEFDWILNTIWEENPGNIAARLLNLADQGLLKQDPKLVLREMLSLSQCHSKSKVPVDILNSPSRLRALLLQTVSSDLLTLFWQQEVQKAAAELERASQAQPDRSPLQRLEAALAEAEQSLESARTETRHSGIQDDVGRFYVDYSTEAYTWLMGDCAELDMLVDDVVDTLRALRCADALRQRGTNLKTSGNYEIFVEQATGDAIIAFRNGDEQLFLTRVSDVYRVGEANLASIELQRRGNLRMSFHRGRFATRETEERAAYAAAFVINDIQRDVIGSFRRPSGAFEKKEELKSHDDILLLIESTDDNLDFAEIVVGQLLRINPLLAGRVVPVPSLQNAPLHEQTRYLDADELDWDAPAKREFLAKLAQFGHKTEDIDLVEAFKHTRLIQLPKGEVLVHAESAAHFVYIPLSAGLKVIPLGGYPPFSVNPWMPLGVTGVIRGAVRNATIVAEEEVDLIAIPKEVFLRHWYHPYSIDELFQKLAIGRR